MAFKPDEEVEDSELIHSPCHRVGVSSVIITQRKNAKTKQKSLERKKEKKKEKKKKKKLISNPRAISSDVLENDSDSLRGTGWGTEEAK